MSPQMWGEGGRGGSEFPFGLPSPGSISGMTVMIVPHDLLTYSSKWWRRGGTSWGKPDWKVSCNCIVWWVGARHCSYILNSVRFRTDSNSVRKINLKIFNKIFRTEFGSEKNKQYSRRKNSEANTVWFKKIWSIFRKITHLLICPPVHLLIWSFQYWHEIAAIWWKQHECESENVKCIVFT